MENPNQNNEHTTQQSALIPDVDIFEDDQGINLYADLPGLSKDKLSIEVENDVLYIKGDMSTPDSVSFDTSLHELSLNHYQRAFTLSKELDSHKIVAELKNGVLHLYIPKQEHAQPKRIQISVG